MKRFLHLIALFLLGAAPALAQVPLGEVVFVDENTFSPTTNEPTNADSTPTCSVYEEDTDTPIINGSSMTARTGHTGEYRFTFTASSGNGFDVGKWYTVKCYATVGAQDGIDIPMHFRVVATEETEGTPVSDLTLWRGTQPNVLSSGRVDSAANVVGTNAINATSYAADTAIYQAKVVLLTDNAGSTDLYLVSFFKNGEPIYAGITSPTIQVVKASDGTDLVASTALTQIGTTGFYRYSEATNRITAGSGYVAKVSATIDSASRTWSQPVGRDTQ